jgi:hypothetical protein
MLSETRVVKGVSAAVYAVSKKDSGETNAYCARIGQKVQSSKELQAEAKIVCKVLCTTQTMNESDDLDLVLAVSV